MTEPEKPASRPPYVPKPSTSGEHAIVREMRAKFESIADHTVAEVEALNERVEQLAGKVSSHPPTPSEEEIDPESDVTPSELRRTIPRDGAEKLPEGTPT